MKTMAYIFNSNGLNKTVILQNQKMQVETDFFLNSESWYYINRHHTNISVKKKKKN